MMASTDQNKQRELLQQQASLQLSLIEKACAKAIKETNKKKQQQWIANIRDRENAFEELLSRHERTSPINESSVIAEVYHNYREQLIVVTYEFHKTASKQDYGIVVQFPTLPKDVVTKDQLTFEDSGDVVISANPVRKARLGSDSDLVFCKNTKPEPAQLEIFAAELFRYTLGSRCTSHGKIITQGKNITGMCIRAIPGFISMRQLTDLTQTPGAYEAKIKKLQAELEKLKEEISTIEEALKKDGHIIRPEDFRAQLKVLEAKRKETQTFIDSYTQIKELINTEDKSINIEKIADIVAKSLCSAFYFQDWDRHKDNFGISYKDGKLDAASLDYDKSLSGIFHQDKKCYDWDITPQRLKNFPDFQCWYWPTSNNTLRSFFSSVAAPEKVNKMYTEAESKQYSALKNNEKFKRQAQIEWLKLIFIPQELHQLALNTLVSSDCDTTLNKVPEILGDRRKKLLNTAIQLNSFKKRLEEPGIFDAIKAELRGNLSDTEFGIVEKNWERIQGAIKDKKERVETLEKVVGEKGYQQFLMAIKTTEISFSPDVTVEKLTGVLDKIDITKSSQTLRNMLNQELGLNISVQDARKIKEEILLHKICESIPEDFGALTILLTEKFEQSDIKIRGKSFFFKDMTLESIRDFKSALGAYEKAKEGGNAEKELKKIIHYLRNLGINSNAISDEALTKSFEKKQPTPETEIEIEPMSSKFGR